MIARRPSNGRSFVTHLLCKGRTIEGRKRIASLVYHTSILAVLPSVPFLLPPTSHSRWDGLSVNLSIPPPTTDGISAH